MRLIEYELGNFKAIGSVQRLKLSPLTLIFGKNSAGKSSVIQSFLLCQHALLKGSFDFGAVSRWGQVIDLGDFRQYVHRHNVDADLSFAFRFRRSERERTSSALDSQVDRTLLNESGSQTEPLWSFCFLNDIRFLSVRLSVGIGDSNDQPHVKRLAIEADNKPFLEFERDELGSLAFVNATLDNEATIIAFASFAIRLGKLISREQQEPATLEEIMESMGSLLRYQETETPRGMITQVEDVYHAIRERLASGRPFDDGVDKDLTTGSRETAAAEQLQAVCELLGQSELFAAGVFEFSAVLREMLREIRFNSHGLRIRQSKDRLPSHSDRFNPETKLHERKDAIDDPIEFFISEAEQPEGTAESLARAFRFDLELLLEAVFESLEYWLGSTCYVGPFRWIPNRLSVSSASSVPVGKEEGSDAMRLLSLDPSVFDKVSDLLQKTLQAPYTLRVRKTAPAVDQASLEEATQRAIERSANAGVAATSGEVSKVFRRYLEGRTARGIYLIDNRNQTEVDFADVGFGISQVLPLLIEAVRDQSGVVCIEQPEVHIHPKMQSDLGDVFIERVRGGFGKSLFVLETHSEHIILRLLRRVRQTTEFLSSTTEIELHPTHIRADELAVHWVEMVDGEAQITVLNVTPQGDFDRNWPEGFFEERIQELPL